MTKYGVKVEWISLAQDRVQGQALLNEVLNRLLHKRGAVS